jgi:hypothetical protein
VFGFFLGGLGSALALGAAYGLTSTISRSPNAFILASIVAAIAHCAIGLIWAHFGDRPSILFGFLGFGFEEEFLGSPSSEPSIGTWFSRRLLAV